MLINQQTDQLDQRLLKGKSLLSRKTYQAVIRKTRSQFMAWQRRQYFLTDAHLDVRRAFHLNEDIALGILIIAFVLTYAYAVVAAQTMFTFFESTFALSEMSGVNFVIMLAITMSILGITFCWLAAFVANALSIALMQGLTRKQHRSLRLTMRQALKQASRTTVVWGLTLGSMAVPLAVAGCLGVLVVLGTGHLLTANARLFTAGSIGVMGLVVSVHNLLRYGLASQVAVFDPELPLAAVLRKSTQLVAKVGRPFISVLYLTFGLVLAIAYMLCSLLSRFVHLSIAISFSVIALASLLYLNSLLTVLYRKRRLSRR